jgi:hypothetical protein
VALDFCKKEYLCCTQPTRKPEAERELKSATPLVVVGEFIGKERGEAAY